MLESLAPRWKKLLADLRAEKGRVVLMLVAVAVSLAAVGAILGSRAILLREIAANYLATVPAHATLELPNGVDQSALAAARALPEVAAAEARDVLIARVEVKGEWRPLLLFVVEDFEAMRLSLIQPLDGAWPPPRGTVLIERTAGGVLAASIGDGLKIKTAGGHAATLKVSGLVHDAGLAPAWQEQTGYAYLARSDLPLLGEPAIAHELRLRLADDAVTRSQIDIVTSRLSSELAASGHAVHEVRIPPPRQHPHQRQMTTVLFLLLAFSLLALVLSAILVANSIAAMLARQQREIGIMKALGARACDISHLYGALIAGLGLAAALPAIPLGRFAAQALSSKVAVMLNFELTDAGVPVWVGGVQLLAGIALPLFFAFASLRSAARVSVTQALARQGAGSDRLRRFALHLPRALREAMRRPARLALTVGLLATAGALFMMALNVSSSWEQMVAKVYQTRHYDFEVRFSEALPIDRVLAANLPAEVRTLETWGFSSAAFARDGKVEPVMSYPDRGHGSFIVLAPPPETKLITLPIIAGRWLQPGDTDAVVLNQSAAAQRGNPQPGDRIELSIDGKSSTWTLVGVVEEIGAASVAYVSDAAFAKLQGSERRARLLRVALDGRAPTPQVMAEMNQALDAAGLPVESILPLASLRTAMSEHILILIRSLLAMALVMATVGALGLASAMGTSVIERSREFAVMKTLGATPQRIRRDLIGEVLAIAGLSGVLAFLMSLPLSALVDALVGGLGFIAPLPFVVHPPAVIAWELLLALLAPLASLVAARRAAAPSALAALAQV